MKSVTDNKTPWYKFKEGLDSLNCNDGLWYDNSGFNSSISLNLEENDSYSLVSYLAFASGICDINNPGGHVIIDFTMADWSEIYDNVFYKNVLSTLLNSGDSLNIYTYYSPEDLTGEQQIDLDVDTNHPDVTTKQNLDRHMNLLKNPKSIITNALKNTTYINYGFSVTESETATLLTSDVQIESLATKIIEEIVDTLTLRFNGIVKSQVDTRSGGIRLHLVGSKTSPQFITKLQDILGSSCKACGSSPMVINHNPPERTDYNKTAPDSEYKDIYGYVSIPWSELFDPVLVSHVCGKNLTKIYFNILTALDKKAEDLGITDVSLKRWLIYGEVPIITNVLPTFILAWVSLTTHNQFIFMEDMFQRLFTTGMTTILTHHKLPASALLNYKLNLYKSAYIDGSLTPTLTTIKMSVNNNSNSDGVAPYQLAVWYPLESTTSGLSCTLLKWDSLPRDISYNAAKLTYISYTTDSNLGSEDVIDVPDMAAYSGIDFTSLEYLDLYSELNNLYSALHDEMKRAWLGLSPGATLPGNYTKSTRPLFTDLLRTICVIGMHYAYDNKKCVNLHDLFITNIDGVKYLGIFKDTSSYLCKPLFTLPNFFNRVKLSELPLVEANHMLSPCIWYDSFLLEDNKLKLNPLVLDAYQNYFSTPSDKFSITHSQVLPANDPEYTMRRELDPVQKYICAGILNAIGGGLASLDAYDLSIGNTQDQQIFMKRYASAPTASGLAEHEASIFKLVGGQSLMTRDGLRMSLPSTHPIDEYGFSTVEGDVRSAKAALYTQLLRKK